MGLWEKSGGQFHAMTKSKTGKWQKVKYVIDASELRGTWGNIDLGYVRANACIFGFCFMISMKILPDNCNFRDISFRHTSPRHWQSRPLSAAPFFSG